jgi:indole-3-glycerol phosphate synthase
MANILEEIVKEKQREIQALLRDGRPNFFSSGCTGCGIRDFKGAITRPGAINLIAEIKYASPSAGIIRGHIDALTVAGIYAEAGAQALSLLTDKKFFGGDLSVMPRLKSSISLPILRKDFIIHEVQILESAHYGADAVLLIAGILPPRQLREFIQICGGLGLAALVEVHGREELFRAIDCGAEIIGINNRNLDTFAVDLNTTLELAPMVPNGLVVVSESGVNGPEDIYVLRRAGVHAVLVGTSLMKSVDIGQKTRELVDAGRSRGQRW